MSDQKVVLITGASSGVGQSTARLLSQKGYKVFGTSRNPAGAEAIPAVEMLAQNTSITLLDWISSEIRLPTTMVPP